MSRPDRVWTSPIVIGLVIALISAIAAVLVVPEVRTAIGLPSEESSPRPGGRAHVVIGGVYPTVGTPFEISVFGFEPGEIVDLRVDFGADSKPAVIELVDGGSQIRTDAKGEATRRVIVRDVTPIVVDSMSFESNFFTIGAIGRVSRKVGVKTGTIRTPA
ncbi:hypothetical protein [Microbispora rosea]